MEQGNLFTGIGGQEIADGPEYLREGLAAHYSLGVLEDTEG